MNRHLKRVLLIIALVYSSNLLFAQSHTVNGVVKDAETSEGVPGATVVEQGTTTGTSTDIEGNFTLTVSSSTATLEISSVGYETITIPIEGKESIEVSLNTELMSLDEIVVVGYGTQKKKVVTGAIASIDAEEITSTPSLRIEQALQGRTAGVQITNLSGQPGEPPTVRIRGAGTTGNAEPLYIVDGMAVGGIDYLNPGDIESIDVLKDAASAAIYGARA
ncbi:MAG: TonB-dependent receptor plug domain-containing protein, partial [Perlabentimonas sp.]